MKKEYLMANIKNVFGRAVFIIILCLVVFLILLSSAYYFQNKVYDLNVFDKNNSITKWKFTTGNNLDEINEDNVIWKYSNEVFGIKKPATDKYIRLVGSFDKKSDENILLFMTQSDFLKVYLDGKELSSTISFNNLTKTSYIQIQLPVNYFDKEIEIIAKSSLIFDVKAAITSKEKIDQSYMQVSQVKVALGLVVSIFGLIMFLISFIISIKIRGVGRIILSGILLTGTGILYIVSELLPILSAYSNHINYKFQYFLLILLLGLIFGISLYTSNKKGVLPKIYLVFFCTSSIPIYSLANDTYVLYYLKFLIVYLLFSTLLYLIFTRDLLRENLFKKKFIYFSMLLSGLSVVYDIANSIYGISPVLAGMYFVSFLLFLTSLANITIAKAIHVNVRINERNDQIRRNRVWIERIFEASSRIFAKQQIDEYCIQTAKSIKELIINDIKETSEKDEETLKKAISDVSVSVAIKEKDVFDEIYCDGFIKDCKYDLIEQRFSRNKNDGIFFGGSYLVILFYIDDTLKSIIYFEGIHNGVSENLKNIIRIAYGNISVAFDNLKLKSDIIQTQQSVFIYLAEMSEAKSLETGYHIKRVAEYVKTICKSLGMSEHETNVVSKASMMHDIGKLAIPEELIKKTGDLSPSEYEIMKQHVTYGHAMLSKSSGEFMEAAAIIAMQHHEKWNGEGYLGLSGENIHLYARITAVADVFDALMRRRSYKDAWKPEEAIGFILEKSGSHFDPKVTDAFIRSIDSIIKIKNEIID